MPENKKKLAAEIVRLVDKHWADSGEALLLSKMGPLLLDSYPDYKSTLSGQSLRNFIKNEASELAIAQHPTMFAKVGAHPAKHTFSYDTDVDEAKAIPNEADKIKESRKAFYTFIKAISELPAEDIKEVQIPTKVIVRLLEGK